MERISLIVFTRFFQCGNIEVAATPVENHDTRGEITPHVHPGGRGCDWFIEKCKTGHASFANGGLQGISPSGTKLGGHCHNYVFDWGIERFDLRPGYYLPQKVRD